MFHNSLFKIHTFKSSRGFTLFEIVIVMAVLAILISIVVTRIGSVDSGRIGEAIRYQKLIGEAVDLYLLDVGFYPPEVDRGCDPGFLQELPLYPDKQPPTCVGTVYTPEYQPADWQDIVPDGWLGPYIDEWPSFNPWNGKYDYNLWPDGALRDGVCVSPGVYISITRNYLDDNPLPEKVEQQLIDDGLDKDLTINGEAHMIVAPLDSSTPVCTQ